MEVQRIRRDYPLEFVHFLDDIFNIKGDWLAEFCERWPREVGLPFDMILMANMTREEHIAQLKSADCVYARIAFEAANDHAASFMKQPPHTTRHLRYWSDPAYCNRNQANCPIPAADIIRADIKAADALLIASPVYWFTMSGQAKTFMDRLYVFGAGSYRELKGKRVGIVLTSGDADPRESGAVNAMRSFQDAFAYLGAPLVGMVHGGGGRAGSAGRNKALMAEAYALGRTLAS